MQARTEPATLEQIYELGRQAAKHMDTGRWTIGDLAVVIETHYGDDDIQKFAGEINVRPKRVYEYRQVASFYDIPRRAEFLDANPMITYTHFRTAMRRGEVEKAYQFLDRASIRGWSSDKADYVMGRLLGKKKTVHSTAAPLDEFEGRLDEARHWLANMEHKYGWHKRIKLILYDIDHEYPVLSSKDPAP